MDSLKKRIFISYSRDDKKFVCRVKEGLESHGFNIFTDQDIIGSDQWIIALEKSLKECDLAIIILSPKWLSSTWCKAEYQTLIQRMNNEKKFRIIPIQIGKLNSSDIPPFLNNIQHIQYLQTSDENTNQLIKKIERVIGGKPIAHNINAGWPLSRVFVVIVVTCFSFILIWRVSTWFDWKQSMSWQEIESIQKSAQKIDDRVEFLISSTALRHPSDEGYIDYLDPDTNRLLARDEFNHCGMLVFRYIYNQEMMAIDEYEYDNGACAKSKLVKKVRKHLDKEKRMVIVDVYDYLNGGPIRKTDYFEGDNNKATTRITLTPKSPPPQITFIPSLIAIYR
jgi:predicted nucleotide-binding protein